MLGIAVRLIFIDPLESGRLCPVTYYYISEIWLNVTLNHNKPNQTIVHHIFIIRKILVFLCHLQSIAAHRVQFVCLSVCVCPVVTLSW